MHDRELIEMIADMWVKCGGDADGFLYTQKKIHEKIKELER